MPKADGNILARWQATLENAACSPLEFYERVESSLTECELPDLQFSYVDRNEGGWFAPRRTYLRIRFRRLYFDVSAFIGGNSLVVGWWLHEDAPGIKDLLAEIPGFGFLKGETPRSATYYAVDYAEFIQRAVHASILRAVEELREENGLAWLPAGEEQISTGEEI